MYFEIWKKKENLHKMYLISLVQSYVLINSYL